MSLAAVTLAFLFLTVEVTPPTGNEEKAMLLFVCVIDVNLATNFIYLQRKHQVCCQELWS